MNNIDPGNTKRLLNITAVVLGIIGFVAGGLLGLDAHYDKKYPDIDVYNAFVVETHVFHSKIEKELLRRWIQSEIRFTNWERFTLRNKELTIGLTPFERERLALVTKEANDLYEEYVKTKY